MGYLWGPTKIASELDLTLLEEPPCAEGVGPETGCGYPPANILIAVNPELPERAPDVIQFLEKFALTSKMEGETEVWMGNNDATTEEAAVWFLQNQDVWTQWVTEGAAANIRNALAAEG